MDSIIKEQDKEVIDWLINDFTQLYSNTRLKYIASKVLKDKARKGIKLIEEQLNNRYQ
jgi:hypothetical protein